MWLLAVACMRHVVIKFRGPKSSGILSYKPFKTDIRSFEYWLDIPQSVRQVRLT